uniref:pirin family protein n=1 Tax=Solibacillus sp. FSL H8-0523 TaxID=2954511 RepID=UPI004047D1C1
MFFKTYLQIRNREINLKSFGFSLYPYGYFANHPHKGIQTATYVVDGALTYYDNFSGCGRLEKNDF